MLHDENKIAYSHFSAITGMLHTHTHPHTRRSKDAKEERTRMQMSTINDEGFFENNNNNKIRRRRMITMAQENLIKLREKKKTGWCQKRKWKQDAGLIGCLNGDRWGHFHNLHHTITADIRSGWCLRAYVSSRGIERQDDIYVRTWKRRPSIAGKEKKIPIHTHTPSHQVHTQKKEEKWDQTHSAMGW